jgi:WD40 repeat protein
MKYKKRSLKKKQRQRHHFSKKYAAAATVQRGGGFMEVISELNAMEGRTNTCMAVHPTQPLVAVGDDAGTVTLFEINPLGQAPPKKLAQLTGLPTAVKCVEFHPTLPLVAAACSDRVLMWKLDQINREQQEGVVQQFKPVSVFGLRSKEEIETEKTKMENTILRANEINDARSSNKSDLQRNEMKAKQLEGLLELHKKLHKREESEETLKKLIDELIDELEKLQKKKEENELKIKELNELEIRLNLKGINTFSIELKIKALERELELDAREVSCIAFRPFRSSVNLPSYISYIAVGVNVNNEKNKQENTIIMCRFKFDTSSVEKLYEFYPILKGEPIPKVYPDVSLMSFSHNGVLFAFVTQSSDGTFLKVMNFEDSTNDYIYKIDQRATSIMSYRSPHYIGGYQHQFIIGCDNGSLLMTQATTINVRGLSTKIRNLNSIREWNARGGPIKCVAVHPSLPLVASGTRGVVTLWDIKDINEPGALQSLDLQDLQDVISVGFNQNFLAVCGPRSMRFYSNEKYNKRKEILGTLHKELIEKNHSDPERCPICFESLTDSSKEQRIMSGPKEEVYLPCQGKHRYHKDCIQKWFNRGNTKCPACNELILLPDLTLLTPSKVLQTRIEHTKAMGKKWSEFDKRVEEETAKRALNFSTNVQGSPPPLAQGSPPPLAQVSPLAQVVAASAVLTPAELRDTRLEHFLKEPPNKSEGGKRKNKNKYSRKKNSSKKSKIRHRYSRKK